MKKITLMAFVASTMVLMTSGVSADNCRSEYMNDTCAGDGYSIVEIEKATPNRGHRHIYALHDFSSIKSAIPEKRVRSTRRYVKRCRIARK